MAAGCSHKVNKEKKDTVRTDSAKEMYEFVDVLGNSYEAELLRDVPRCKYDYSRLVEEGGFRYYTDEGGNKISKIGIDVSEYQTSVDWTQVKASGIEFAIIRAGYRGYGEEGKLVEDAMFRSHMEGAKAAGIETGVYFFSQAVSDEEAEEEAEFILNLIKDYDITYPVVFDTEEIKEETARTYHLSKGQFTDNCIVFCDMVSEAGYDTMIYANMKWMAYTLDLEKLREYDKWYADYEPEPQCPYEFSMWQYTEKGSVPGIEGNVDLNVQFER